MEGRFERVRFDDINDDKFLGVEEEQKPGAPATIEADSDKDTPAKEAAPVTAQQVRETAQIPSNLVPALITLGLTMVVLSQMTIEVSKVRVASAVSSFRNRLLR